MAVNWNEQQQTVIDHRDGNLLVSAAAGSGKTAVLTEHVLRMVMDPQHPMEIDRLLIMTFTTAAASEMRERIRLALQNALESPDCDDAMCRHLRRQLVKLPFASISTIHSFCLNVIRENFFRIGLEPNLAVSDETETKLLLSDVIDAVLEPYYLDADSEAFRSLGMLFGNRKSALSRAIEEIYGKSREYVDPNAFLDGAIEVYSGRENERLRNDLNAFEKKKMWPLLHAEKRSMDLADAIARVVPASKTIDGIEKMAFVARGAYEQQTLADAIAYLKDPDNKIPSLSPSKAEKEQYAELFEYAKSEKEKITKIFTDIKKLTPITWDSLETEMSRLRPQIVLLKDILRNVDELFASEKKKRRLMDFDDLEHYALQLLSDPDVAAVYRQRFEEILVDEYQDSNGMQEALITSICRSPENGGTSNVFMVGDVKQSIYGFRRADPELFIEKFDRYRADAEAGTLVCLNANYRSRKGVLNGINRIFENLMTKERGGIVYDETARLNPGAEYPGDEEAVPRIFLESVIKKDPKAKTENDSADGTDNTEGTDPSEIFEDGDTTDETGEGTAPEGGSQTENEDIESPGLQAVLIGQRIRQIVGHEQVYDLKKKAYRPASYRDIVILMRSVKNVEDQFMPTLRDRFDIPCVSTEGSAYFETPEVRDLIEFLRILDNPLQDIPLATVLASPMFDFTPTDLAQIRVAAPKTDWFFTAVEGYEGQEGDLGKKTGHFLAIYRDLRDHSSFSSIPELLESILQMTDFRSKIGAMPGGRGREINVNMLLLKAADFEKTNYRGIDRFLRYIDRMKEKEIILAEPNKLSEEDDVVRVMTIHKSKGLEFPIVFLADAQKDLKRTSGRRSMIVYHPEYRLAFDYVNPLLSIRILSNLKDIIADMQQDESLYEEARVLYVAMTRAKERLYVIGCMKEAPDPNASETEGFTDEDFDSKPSYMNWILRSLRGTLEKSEVTPGRVTYSGGDFVFRTHSEEVVQKDYERLAASQEASNGDASEDGTEASAEEDDIEALREIAKRFAYVYPYAALGDQKAIVSVSEVKHRFMEEEGVSFEAVAAQSGEAEPKTDAVYERETSGPAEPKSVQKESTGAQRGTAVHNVMEHLNFIEVLKQEDRIDYIREQIETLTKAGVLEETTKELVDPRKIAHFFDSRLAVEMAQAEERNALKREVRFLYAIPAFLYLREYQEVAISDAVTMQPDQVLVRGIIDAYYADAEGHLVIMDYKTDSLPAEGGEDILTRRYLAQLKLYKEALENMLGTMVKACVLYSFSLGKEILLPI